MANQIRQWNDLADPGIDPFEYPRELPQHFSDVEKLLTDESAMFEDAADTAKRNAATFGDYVEYLNTAEVAAGVISPILDAAEEIHNWVAAIRQASESMSRAAGFVKAAQRAAEGEYGDWDVPRFDKSN